MEKIVEKDKKEGGERKQIVSWEPFYKNTDDSIDELVAEEIIQQANSVVLNIFDWVFKNSVITNKMLIDHVKITFEHVFDSVAIKFKFIFRPLGDGTYEHNITWNKYCDIIYTLDSDKVKCTDQNDAVEKIIVSFRDFLGVKGDNMVKRGERLNQIANEFVKRQ